MYYLIDLIFIYYKYWYIIIFIVVLRVVFLFFRGELKIWYGVLGDNVEDFERFMKEVVLEFFEV